jgi:hypothetical protein
MISEFKIKSYELTPWSNKAAPPFKPELSFTFLMIDLKILTQLKELADITCPSRSEIVLLSMYRQQLLVNLKRHCASMLVSTLLIIWCFSYERFYKLLSKIETTESLLIKIK